MEAGTRHDLEQNEELESAIDDFDKDIRRHSQESYKLGFEVDPED
jgi:hypothetical protein